jgi:hypothetical protein
MASTEPDPAAGLAPLLLRQGLGFLVLWGTLAAWWYPAPVLVAVQEVEWGERYDRAHAPGNPALGMIESARELIRRDSAVPSLPRWIEQQTEGRALAVEDADWPALARELRTGGGPEPARAVFPGDDPRLAGLAGRQDATRRFVSLRTAEGTTTLEVWLLRPGDAAHASAPARLRYPLRALWPGLLLLALMAAAATQVRPASQSRLADSVAGTGLKWSLGFLTAGAAIVTFASLAGLGYNAIAVAVLGGFVVLAGVVALAVVGWHAVVIARVLSGRDLLLTWSYEGAAWRRFAEQDAAERVQQAKALVVMTALIAAVIVSVFLVVAEDKAAAGVAALVVVGAIALAAGVAWAGVRAVRRRYSAPRIELFLGRDGLWLAGMTHVWSGLGARLESAAIVDGENGVSALEIVYSVIQSSGPRTLFFHRRHETVRLPVPAGEEQAARRAVETLAHRSSRGVS